MWYLNIVEPHRAQQSNHDFPSSHQICLPPSGKGFQLVSSHICQTICTLPGLQPVGVYLPVSHKVNQRSQSHPSTATREQAPHLLTSCQRKPCCFTLLLSDSTVTCCVHLPQDLRILSSQTTVSLTCLVSRCVFRYLQNSEAGLLH